MPMNIKIWYAQQPSIPIENYYTKTLISKWLLRINKKRLDNVKKVNILFEKVFDKQYSAKLICK